MFRDASYDRWETGDARLTWVPSGETLVISGLTAQYHRTLQQTWADGLPTVRQDPVNGTGSGDIPEDYASLNAYLLMDQHLSDPLRVELAATYYWHQLFGSRLTPKAALVWTPGDRDVLKLIYSEGFRTPTVSEAFYEDGSSYLANPKLRPEVVDAGEVIYEHRYRSVATVTVNAFLHHYRSLIQFESVPAPGVQNPDPANPSDFRMQALNVGSLWLRGAAIAGTVSLGRWLQEPMAEFPPRTSARAAGSISPRGLQTWPFLPGPCGSPSPSPSILAATSRRDYDPGNLPANGSTSVVSLFLLSAGAVFDIPAVHGLSAEFRVQNLLGTSAPDPLPADSAPVTSLPKPPRTFRLGLRYQFE